MKKFVKDNAFYILFFIGFFLISLLFPYTGDDWVWGTYKLNLETITNLSVDLELNGRYIGNIIAIILTRNIVIRGLVMSLVMTLLLRIINRCTGGKKYLDIFLLVCIPACVFKQVIPWSAGFANYMVSTLVLFWIIDLLLNNKEEHYMLAFLLCFIGSLFLENNTIFILGFTIFLNVRYYIKNKKINKLYLFAFLGSAIGTFIMFSHPSYIRTVNGDNKARYIGQQDNLVIHNYFYNFMLYGVNANYVIFALLEIVLFVHAFKKDRLTNKRLTLFIISYVFLLYIVFTESFPALYEKVYFNGIVATLFLITLMLIFHDLFKKKKEFNYFWYGVLLCMFITGPLIIVNTIGPRNFFIVYLIIGMITIKIYNDLFKNTDLFNKIMKGILVFLVGYYIVIFGRINYANQEREKYIYDHRCEGTIYVARLPHHKYIWWPDFEYKYGDYYSKYYIKKHNLSNRIIFIFEDYDKWKINHKKDVSTCS